MHATRWHADRDIRVDEVPAPEIERPTEALVRVTLAGICGTDLHLYNAGSALGLPEGMRIGHEFVGVVEAVGKEVTRVRPGDRVVAPFAFCDDHCYICDHGMHCNCPAGGIFGFAPLWRSDDHGSEIQGGQSEIVRVPLADGTLVRIPDALARPEMDRSVLPLADVFSTGWHGAVNAGVGTGDTVVVIGDGAVGLCAVQSARVLGAGEVVLIGHHPDRLDVGRRTGATHVVDTRANGEEAADRLVARITGDRGADAVVDCISTAATLAHAFRMVRPGGAVSYVGLGFEFEPPDGAVYKDTFWRNVSLHGGVAPTRNYIERLLPLVASGRIDPGVVFTDVLPLGRAAEGYRIMDDRRSGSIKVALTMN